MEWKTLVILFSGLLSGALRGEETGDGKKAPERPGKALEGHGETIYQVAFSPDSSRLATASFDHTVTFPV